MKEKKIEEKWKRTKGFCVTRRWKTFV